MYNDERIMLPGLHCACGLTPNNFTQPENACIVHLMSVKPNVITANDLTTQFTIGRRTKFPGRMSVSFDSKSEINGRSKLRTKILVIVPHSC